MARSRRARAVHPLVRGAGRRPADRRDPARPGFRRAAGAPGARRRSLAGVHAAAHGDRARRPCPPMPRQERAAELGRRLGLEIELLEAGDISGATPLGDAPRELVDDSGRMYYLWRSAALGGAIRLGPFEPPPKDGSRACCRCCSTPRSSSSSACGCGRCSPTCACSPTPRRNSPPTTASRSTPRTAPRSSRSLATQSRRHVRARQPAHPEPEGNDRGAVARDAHAAGAGAFRGRRARGRGRRTPAPAAARREQRRAADRRPDLRHARLRAARSPGPAHGLPVRRRSRRGWRRCSPHARRTSAS